MSKAIIIHKFPLTIEALEKFRRTLLADDVSLTQAINGKLNALEKTVLAVQVLQRTERIITALLEERIAMQEGK